MEFDQTLSQLSRCLNNRAQKIPSASVRFDVLQLVQLKGAITLRKLCDIQKVTMPTMSKLVDELQNSGLVIRAQSKEDARQRWIAITQKGSQQLKQVQKEREVFWQHKLATITRPQQQDLQQAILLLIELLESGEK